jgi:hypothetical protein
LSTEIKAEGIFGIALGQTGCLYTYDVMSGLEAEDVNTTPIMQTAASSKCLQANSLKTQSNSVFLRIMLETVNVKAIARMMLCGCLTFS